MKKTILLFTVFCFHLGISLAQDLPMVRMRKLEALGATDKINNQTYGTVSLGDQIWFMPSIKSRRYNDGKQIPRLYGDKDLNSTQIGAYRITQSTLKNSYGYEYNGYAVETNKLCPKGWRTGTLDDYRELAKYLQSDSVASVMYSHLIDTNQYSISEGRPVRCIKEK